MQTIYIGIGSNLDEPQLQVEQALVRLTMLPDTRFVQASSYYISEPFGPIDQPDFINLVAELQTNLATVELLHYCQAIEQGQGRVRTDERWGPRRIDVDIILYGNESINTSALTIPHPGLWQRDFVLVPLFEIAPSLVLPNGEPLSEILKKCPKRRLVKLADKFEVSA